MVGHKKPRRLLALALLHLMMLSHDASASMRGCSLLSSEFISHLIEPVRNNRDLATIVHKRAQFKPVGKLLHQSDNKKWESVVGTEFQVLPNDWASKGIWLSQRRPYFSDPKGFSLYEFKKASDWVIVQLSEISDLFGFEGDGSVSSKWLELNPELTWGKNRFSKAHQNMLSGFQAPTHSKFYDDLKIASFVGNDSKDNLVVFVVTTPEAFEVKLVKPRP